MASHMMPEERYPTQHRAPSINATETLGRYTITVVKYPDQNLGYAIVQVTATMELAHQTGRYSGDRWLQDTLAAATVWVIAHP